MNIMVANRLADLRKRRGLSQEQLAEQLGISRQAVSKWERAESSPDTDNLIALARLYGVSLDMLVQMDAESEADEQFAIEAARLEREREQEEPEIECDAEESGDRPHFNWYVFPYPVIVTLLYLLMGIFLDLWHPGWLLYLTVPIYYTAIDGDGFNLNKVPYPLLVVPMYLIMGFAWDWWHPGWLIFLTIPIYYTVMHRYVKGAFNLILISLMVMGVFAMLGWAMGGFGRWLLSGTGAVLVGLAAMVTTGRKDGDVD